jgi:hypothetical protein
MNTTTINKQSFFVYIAGDTLNTRPNHRAFELSCPVNREYASAGVKITTEWDLADWDYAAKALAHLSSPLNINPAVVYRAKALADNARYRCYCLASR